MITEDYVSFEIAKLLKEKGFDGGCAQLYNFEKQIERATWPQTVRHDGVYMDRNGYILCPTIQMTMKWLREVHNIHIVIKSVIRTYLDTEYYYELYGTKNKSLCVVCDIYKGESWDSSENDSEAAIKYCLEKLI